MSDDEDPANLGARDLIGLGGILLGCLVVGLAIGWLIDDAVGSSPVFTLLGLAVGIACGVLGSWLRVRRYLDI
ncbi:MAG: AtpZ/AtpI family protein [Nocardioidaceae bacterium]